MEAAVLLVWLAGVLIVGLAHKWAMLPLYRLAAGKPKTRIRFGIADFLCLFVQVQVVLPLLVWLSRDACSQAPVPAYTVLAILVAVIAYATWWDPVRTLNRAGISTVRPRICTLVIAAP